MKSTRKFPRAKPHRLSSVEVKALVRFRDGYRCQGCGMTSREHFSHYKKALDVHRLAPGSRYTVKGCVTLCKKCHGQQPKSDAAYGRANMLHVWIDSDLRDALEVACKKHRRKLRDEVSIALEDYLRRLGLWSDEETKGGGK